MCTVTYLPLGANQFLLTSNRDETPKRQPQSLFRNEEKGLLYPKEPSQGGTWICVAQNNRVLCLLNGAFDKHHHQPPYKRSRGLVLLDFFDYSTATAFFQEYNFEGIEPFTLVVFDNGALFDFRWDGSSTHVQALDAQKPYIWSSSTLYPQAIKDLRQLWFDAWLQRHPTYHSEDILAFHEQAGIGDPENDLIMSRHQGALCTVSTTHIIKKEAIIKVIYKDRIEQNVYESSIDLTR